MWKKIGQFLEPDPTVSWMSSYAGPTFAISKNDQVNLYVTGRNQFNQSEIGRVTINVKTSQSLPEIIKVEQEAIFKIGQIGTFDESGVSYPWIVDFEGRLYMYYVGWVAGGRTRFQNYTGLAISDDGGSSFNRVSSVPILERSDQEPYGSGSCAVWLENGQWNMIYTAFGPWIDTSSGAHPSYRLKEAVSKDGINWVRTGRIVVDFVGDNETIIGKPMIIKDIDCYRLWYSHRGDSYRIGYAESDDGTNFIRKDKSVGITTSDHGWDSEMIEYAFVFDHQKVRYMIYNGNQFGKTGLGIATWIQ
jgi:predicted GH43/DUF377 family glycosyl hydrolase